MKVQCNQTADEILSPEGPLIWFNAFVKLLNESFEFSKSKNKYYSVRRHAQMLGISVGSLSEIMRGKRRLSPEKAKQILEKLKVSAEQRLRILFLMGEDIDFSKGNELFPKGSELEWAPERELIAAYFALSGVEVASSLVAQRLGIDLEKVEKIINDCLACGLLVKDENGSFVKKNREELFLSQVCFASDKDFKKKHQDSLELAQKALELNNSESADFISFTFPGNAEDIDFFKKEMRKVLYKMSLHSEGTSGTRVVRISSQAFFVDVDKKTS